MRYIPYPSSSLSSSLARQGSYGIEEDTREEKEALHCLRMIRCSAARVHNPGTSIHLVQDTWNEERAKVIHGWPPDGGVCVYNLFTATPSLCLDEA